MEIQIVVFEILNDTIEKNHAFMCFLLPWLVNKGLSKQVVHLRLIEDFKEAADENREIFSRT